MARAAPTQEAARRRFLAETLRASSGIWSPTGGASGELTVGDAGMVWESELAAAVALQREAWRARNCSTADCGLSSLAQVLSSAYILQVKQ